MDAILQHASKATWAKALSASPLRYGMAAPGLHDTASHRIFLTGGLRSRCFGFTVSAHQSAPGFPVHDRPDQSRLFVP